jgi:NAD+ synthase (glutamine-hydrolysing)
MRNLRLALAQTNPTVGDIDANIEAILNAVETASQFQASIISFGEMVVTGYPIEDLATREHFVKAAETAVSRLAKSLNDRGFGNVAVVVGHPSLAAPQARNGWAISHNSASVLLAGEVVATYSKHHLPNYSVFDEYRNFVPGSKSVDFEFEGLRIGLAICEDIWQEGDPIASLSQRGCDLVLVLNGSPFEMDKDDRRTALVQKVASTTGAVTAYVNLVGGQDDLIFDGDSFVANPDGEVVGRAAQFAEDLLVVDINPTTKSALLASSHKAHKLDDDWQVWNALVLGLRDYCAKNGFKSVVLGLSGGIDSAVCAAIAAEALGAPNVYGISMPSVFSSDHSKSDAADLAERLGCNYFTVPIEPMVNPFEDELQLSGLASENLQARVRGVVLMGLSNQHGHLTLTTGNKTELAVGYSTIYGDSVGGFAPLKDVEKTMVWRLARWRNEHAEALGQVPPIPQNSISKPPSAELRPGQTDQDSLPPYETLDAILERYVGLHMSPADIAAEGYEPSLVSKIVGLVDKAEWKRRQSAIGPKITGMAFGRDRRLPITNRFKE